MYKMSPFYDANIIYSRKKTRLLCSCHPLRYACEYTCVRTYVRTCVCVGGHGQILNTSHSDLLRFHFICCFINYHILIVPGKLQLRRSYRKCLAVTRPGTEPTIPLKQTRYPRLCLCVSEEKKKRKEEEKRRRKMK